MKIRNYFSRFRFPADAQDSIATDKGDGSFTALFWLAGIAVLFSVAVLSYSIWAYNDIGKAGQSGLTMPSFDDFEKAKRRGLEMDRIANAPPVVTVRRMSDGMVGPHGEPLFQRCETKGGGWKTCDSLLTESQANTPFNYKAGPSMPGYDPAAFLQAQAKALGIDPAILAQSLDPKKPLDPQIIKAVHEHFKEIDPSTIRWMQERLGGPDPAATGRTQEKSVGLDPPVAPPR